MPTPRPLGRSGLAIPPLVLGGNVFGWTADRAASFAVLDRFVDGGGTMIDTADVYSAFAPGNVGGESERMIGEWLKASGKRESVLIATKVGLLAGPGGDKLAPARIAAAIDASLARLGTDRIDLYFAHRDDETRPVEEPLEAFDRLVTAGKVRALGASNFTANRLAEALDASTKAGWARYDVLQPEYNLLERDFEKTLQPLCLAQDVAVTPYYGLAAGYLTGKYRTPADIAGARSGAARKYMDGAGPRMLTAMDAVVAETGASHAQVALAWIAARPAVAAPIASATSAAQVDDLLGAMVLALTPAQVATLDGALA